MKGIIFNLLEETVTGQCGAAVWDELLVTAGSDGVYPAQGSYPDAQLQALVMAAALRLGKSPAEVLRWFGNAALPLLAARYPVFFEKQTSARGLLVSVQAVVHPQVLKSYPGAGLPEMEFRDCGEGGLLMTYNSPRKLCALAQGFAEGAAAYYGETIEFTHVKCVHRGDEHCVCEIAFVS